MGDRAFIMSELQRLAERDGKAPGEMTFQKETGVGRSQWLRFWPRWGDALAEAGLEQQSFNTSIPTDDLFGRLATFVEQLGRFPTKNELAHRAHSEPDFPHYATFVRRFGNKAGIERAFAEWAAASPDRSGLANLVGPATPTPPASVSEADPPVLTSGYVYLIKSGRFYKIGRANDVGRRAYEIRLTLPEDVDLVHQIETDDDVGIERYWHQRFADRRAKGEWFSLTRADVAAFRRRKFM